MLSAATRTPAAGQYSAALCRGLIEASARRKPTQRSNGYSAALCRGLIEARPPASWSSARSRTYSAALCRGLIEAPAARPPRPGRRAGIPRLYAAASLKLEAKARTDHVMDGIPRLYAAASLKQQRPAGHSRGEGAYSAALCRGLIEAAAPPEHGRSMWRYSAALCRGLIEARLHHVRSGQDRAGIPRLYAAASLKRRAMDDACLSRPGRVFRGFMPRPH